MALGLRTFTIVSLTGLLAAIPACSRSSTKPQIAVVTNCVANFWSICEAGARKAAAEKDVDLSFRMPEKMEVASQRPILDAELKRGAAGLAVSVINPKEQTPDLKRYAASVPLITMDNDADQSGRLCYVGIDNYEAGKAVGRLVKKAMPDGGIVALFIGSTSSANAQGRVGGVVDELAGVKGAQGPQLGKYTYFLNEPKTDGGNETDAQKNALAVLKDDAIKGQPNVCFVGLYAYNPAQILLAVRKDQDARGKVKIVGFDEDNTTLEGIASGEVVGTVVQDPFQYGYRSVSILADRARGLNTPLPTEMIPYRVVTKDGGPDEVVNGVKVQNIPVAEFAAKLKADLASVGK